MTIFQSYFMPEAELRYSTVADGHNPEIEDVRINGDRVGDDLYLLLLRAYKDRWEGEIRYHLDKERSSAWRADRR